MTGNRKHRRARQAGKARQVRRNAQVPAHGSPEDGAAMLAAFADAHAVAGVAGGDTLDVMLLVLARLPRGTVVMMRDTAVAMVAAAEQVLRERS